ncbi:MAG: hypothetical protein ACR2G2_04165 [Pseudonocardia sp.]
MSARAKAAESTALRQATLAASATSSRRSGVGHGQVTARSMFDPGLLDVRGAC